MRRGLGFATSVLVLAVALASASAHAIEIGACRKVALIDKLTDDSIFGIEDIEIDGLSGTVLVSAFDRWALEDAIAADSETLPQGGVYAFSMDGPKEPPARIAVDDLSAGFKLERDFRPQGLTLTGDGPDRRLLVVNRRHLRADGDWKRRPMIEVFAWLGDTLDYERSLSHPTICHPNAVTALAPDSLLVTNDHGACGSLGAWLEDILPLDRANLVRLTIPEDPGAAPDAEPVAAGFRFANGLAVSRAGGGQVYLADTRKDRIAVYDAADLQDGTTARPAATLSLTAGPDNLKWAPDGRLISAVHPDLLGLGLYVKRWFGVTHAPSRVLAISPNDGASEVLFDDPKGDLISAATAAAVHDGWLIVGSAFDRGLVICRLPGAAAQVEAAP